MQSIIERRFLQTGNLLSPTRAHYDHLLYESIELEIRPLRSPRPSNSLFFSALKMNGLWLFIRLGQNNINSYHKVNLYKQWGRAVSR